MRTLLLGAVGLFCFGATEALAQSRAAEAGACQYFEGPPHIGFTGAMEGGSGVTVPGQNVNSSVTTSGFGHGLQLWDCSATIGLIEVGKSEPGGRRSRARIQNTDGPPGGGGG